MLPFSEYDARIYLDFGDAEPKDVKSAKLKFYASSAKWSDKSQGTEALGLMVIGHCPDSLLITDRTDWLADTSDTGNSMLFFNAKSGGAHAHRDALSLMFYAGGRELLTDRGTLTYDEGAEENVLRTKTEAIPATGESDDSSIGKKIVKAIETAATKVKNLFSKLFSR